MGCIYLAKKVFIYLELIYKKYVDKLLSDVEFLLKNHDWVLEMRAIKSESGFQWKISFGF